jgi:septin family protein
MEILENLSGSFAQLRQILSQPEIKTVMVLMGNKSAGKTTFIHYLMETQLTEDDNDDGEQILSIGDKQYELNEVTVIEDLLEVVEVPKEGIVFVEVIGFESEEEEEHSKKWSLTMDYLLYVLSTLKPEVKTSFILIFTFSEFK